MKALEISDLSYTYRSDFLVKKFEALCDVSVTVSPGEAFGFLGHNGAGKTTTIKCILGLIKPALGTIKIFGIDYRETAARTAVGYLPEQPYFYDHLTVQELLELYATLSGVPASDRAAAVAKALDTVGLGFKAKAKMRSLSKGLTQRAALAQALVHSPKLLILDEPFSGLDPIGRKEFRDIFLALKQQGVTLFMSSHILSDVEFLCDRASIMVKGKIAGIYSIKDLPTLRGGTYELTLRASQAIKEVLSGLGTVAMPDPELLRFNSPDRAKAEQALRKALDAGVHIESFEFHHPSLEDIFVELVNQSKNT